MKKVTVAISGGVDSSVSVALLQQQGYIVDGLFMCHRYQKFMPQSASRSILERLGKRVGLRVYSVDAFGVISPRSWSDEAFSFILTVDAAAAMEVAASLGIQLSIIDADAPFNSVVSDFVSRYYSAQTPNPCVLCNRSIKFGILLGIAMKLGADYFATGHYVQRLSVRDWRDSLATCRSREALGDDFEGAKVPDWLADDDSLDCILCSPSPKDQSYFLYGIRREIIGRLLFPVGNYKKEEVRRIAALSSLPVAHRKDSQEVCFLSDRDRSVFLKRFSEFSEALKGIPTDTSGPFVDLEGKEIGRHRGYEMFTIGQRKGLGIGFGERVFVQRINPESRTVQLGPYESLAVSEIRAINSNWHVQVPFDEAFHCLVKIRFRNEPVPAIVKSFSDGSIFVKTARPCYGVAPGQALVCYWGNRLIGGGTITL